MLKISTLISVFYPLNCKSCEEPLVKGETYFCLHCELNFGEIFNETSSYSEIEQLFWGKVKVENTFAAYQFLKQENLQRLIHEFKYKGNKKLAYELGALIGTQAKNKFEGVNVVSFVPMFKSRELKRGYNQAEVLAKGFSSTTGIKVENLLERAEATTTQTEKGVYERFENMEGKFKLLKNLKDKSHVLLIDDVITTGATLASCAKVLTNAGVKVSIVCLAYRGLNN